LEAERPRDAHTAREAKERTAQDLMFEKEYVVIDKQAVAVNAFADELDAQPHLQVRGPGSGAMLRRATTQACGLIRKAICTFTPVRDKYA